MIDDLDESLRRVLDDAGAPVALRNAAISFETPDRTFTVQELTLDLFLHGVKENVEVRDVVPVVRREGGAFRREAPPVRVDCAYLVTAWSNGTGAARVSAEHSLLGLALAWLKRFATIPSRFLVGAMADQPFPPIVSVAWADSTPNRGEFWGALGTSPRPAFDLVVTVALELDSSFEEATVTTVEYAYELPPDLPPTGPEERSFHVGGRVVDPAGQPLAGVLIEAATGARATTGARGEWVLASLGPGTHVLTLHTAGYATATVQVEVPGTGGDRVQTLVPEP